MNAPFRPEPRMPAAAYKTYQLAAPLRTHWRAASCEEAGCLDWRYGWRLRVEGLDPAMLHTAQRSGRRWRRLDVAEGETYLVFEAGQPCFRASQHRVRVDRAELYLVRDGDHRGNPRGTDARRLTAQQWTDDFGEHQERLADAIERG